MPNICISVSLTQDEEIRDLMAIEGYVSRSEFLRFLVKFYKYHEKRDNLPNDLKDPYKRGEATKMREYQRKCGDDW